MSLAFAWAPPLSAVASELRSRPPAGRGRLTLVWQPTQEAAKIGEMSLSKVRPVLSEAFGSLVKSAPSTAPVAGAAIVALPVMAGAAIVMLPAIAGVAMAG